MNAENLARATFVLDRPTYERLAYLSRRMGQSRSELVRGLLEEPIREMDRLMRMVPDNPTEADLRQMRLEGLDLVDRVASGARDVLTDSDQVARHD